MLSLLHHFPAGGSRNETRGAIAGGVLAAWEGNKVGSKQEPDPKHNREQLPYPGPPAAQSLCPSMPTVSQSLPPNPCAVIPQGMLPDDSLPYMQGVVFGKPLLELTPPAVFIELLTQIGLSESRIGKAKLHALAARGIVGDGLEFVDVKLAKKYDTMRGPARDGYLWETESPLYIHTPRSTTLFICAYDT